MVYGVVDAGIADVLNEVEKLFWLPFTARANVDTPLIVIITVPVSIGGPLTRPPKFIDAVPNEMDCEAVRLMKLAVALFTVSVKLCVAFVPTPLLAVIVIGYELALPSAGVPLSTPAEVNVTPLGRAPVSVNVGAGKPVAVTVNDPAEVTVNVVLLALVIAGGCPTESVKL